MRKRLENLMYLMLIVATMVALVSQIKGFVTGNIEKQIAGSLMLLILVIIQNLIDNDN